MQTVKVKKEELLEKLTQNLKKHKKEYKEALKDRKRAAINELSTYIPDNELFKKENTIPEVLKFPMPISNIESYENAIEMVKMSIDKDLTLTKQEFEQYVLDKWIWKVAFDSIASSYKSK